MPWTRSRATVLASAGSSVVDHAAVAEAAEVLRRIEAERRRRGRARRRAGPGSRRRWPGRRLRARAGRAGAAIAMIGSMSAHLAVQVDRDDRPGARGDRRLDPGRVDVVGLRLDVDEDRPRPVRQIDAAGGEEGVRRGDDLVAGADRPGHQGQQQGIRAGGAADRVGHAAVLRRSRPPAGDLGTQDELLALDAPPRTTGSISSRIVRYWAFRSRAGTATVRPQCSSAVTPLTPGRAFFPSSPSWGSRTPHPISLPDRRQGRLARANRASGRPRRGNP